MVILQPVIGATSSDTAITRRWLFGMALGVVCLSGSGCGFLQHPPPPPPSSAERSASRASSEQARVVEEEVAVVEMEQISAENDATPETAPALRVYTDWTLQETALDALGRIGAAAVPDLARALRDPDPEMRRRVAEVLGRIGPDAAVSVPHLVTLLEDSDSQVRRAAARSLGQIGPNAPSAVRALMRLLEDPASP